MPMNQAANQVPLGDQLFFASPIAASDQCLIFGHSGELDGDPNYTLPPTVSMHFYMPHRTPRVANPTQAILTRQHEVVSTIGPGNIVANYTVRKGVGSGFPQSFTSYADVQNHMQTNAGYAQHVGGNWCPHFVSICRRRLRGGITLSQIIPLVTGNNPGNTEFFWGGCRSSYAGHPVVFAFLRVRLKLMY